MNVWFMAFVHFFYGDPSVQWGIGLITPLHEVGKGQNFPMNLVAVISEDAGSKTMEWSRC